MVGNGGTTGTLGNLSVTNNATLAFNRSDAAGSFSNVISGTGMVKQVGPGTTTLTGANTYTGSTTISAGTLSLGASNVIPDGSAVVLGGGTLQTGTGQTETAASLGLTANATISMGGTSGISILTFNNVASSGFTSNTLSIWNWNGSLSGGGDDRLIIPAGSLGLAELANISFYSDSGGTLATGSPGAAFAPGGEIVPVPEVSTMVSLSGVLAFLGFRRRRRRPKTPT